MKKENILRIVVIAVLIIALIVFANLPDKTEEEPKTMSLEESQAIIDRELERLNNPTKETLIAREKILEDMRNEQTT